MGKSKGEKSKCTFWITGKKKARVYTDGNWIHVDMPKGRQVRIEVSDALRASIGGGSGSTASAATGSGGGVDADLESFHRRKRKKNEGPVPFRSFDYEDEYPTREVYVKNVGWKEVPKAPAGTQPPPDPTLKNVVASRVVRPNGSVIATGSPAPQNGEFIVQVSGSHFNLTNTNQPAG
ncbi:MAG: hypothetical protein WBA92_14275 [Pseudorhodobacter sp.]